VSAAGTGGARRRAARIAAWTGALAALAAGIGWALSMPYRPMGIYEAFPDGVTAVSRHVAVAERWEALTGNPLLMAVAKALGVSERDAKAMGEEGEARKWLEKLTGRELALAYRPASRTAFGGGRADAWLGAAWLGGGAQRLRWQLQLFRVPGYTKLDGWPGHAAWRVDGVDTGDGRILAIAFEEGVLLAALSADEGAIGDLLEAKDGHRRRLAEASESFRAFAQGDDRRTPDAAWVRSAEGPAAQAVAEIDEAGPSRLAGTLRCAWGEATGMAWPEDGEDGDSLERPAALLGDAPCAAAVLSREALVWAMRWPGLDPAWAHGLRMLLTGGGRLVVAAVLDGELRGELAVGPMRAIGLGGLKVPTLVLATPADGGEEAARRKLQAVLDSCNARYRAAFLMRPAKGVGAVRVWTLESAGGDEWVDALDIDGRPACALADGWLYVCSNLGALRRLLSGGGRGGAEGARWAAGGPGAGEGAPARLWVDFPRGGKAALDLLGTCSLAMRWLPGAGDARPLQELTRAVRGWNAALAPFGEGRTELRRPAGAPPGWVDARAVLGLPEGGEAARIAP